MHCIFDQAVIGLSWPVVREGMVLDDPAPFANHDPLIGVHAGDGLHVAPRAVRPADRQIRFVAWPMPKCTRKSPWEMWYPPLRTSSISFRSPTLSVNRAPMESRPWPEVLQQLGRLEEIDDNNLLGAVVVEDADCDTAGRVFCRKRCVPELLSCISNRCFT